MSFSNEEIKKGSISIFDHKETWVKDADIHALLRMIDFMPLVEQALIDELINRLTDKDIFKQLIKSKCNQAQKYIDSVTDQIYRQYGYRKRWEKDDTADEHAMDHCMFSVDMVAKIAQSLFEYQLKLDSVTNVYDCLTPEQHRSFFIENSTMLCKLNPGDKFLFLDQSQAVEYTYVKLLEKKDKIFCVIDKVTEDMTFEEEDVYRPVIKMNMLGNDMSITLQNFFKKMEKYKKFESQEEEEVTNE